MKYFIYKLYGILISLLKHPILLKDTIKSHFSQEIYENRNHLLMAGDWLLMMQNEDGGYSRKFSFFNGFDNSYVETTGYIIPTLIELGKKLKESKYINSALKAGEFLLSIQNEDGSFNEIDTIKPFAFDTGQCLLGLNYLYKYTNEKKYKKSIYKASKWLIENQEENGSWIKVAYNNIPHSYYVRVGYALYEAGKILGDINISDYGIKNLKWTLNQQQENGFFKYSSFINSDSAYLHTLMYILEGLILFYKDIKDEKILDSILRYANQFLNISQQNDLILCSEYNSNFQCVNKERCVTGLAQFAGVMLDIFEITKKEEYKNEAIKIIFYLKSKQIKKGLMKGGFSASIPFWGKYGGFDFVNWNNKFFIDALLKFNKLNISHNKMQEEFVKSAFNVTSSVVTDTLSFMDKRYISQIEIILKNERPKKVLNIGCGKGVIIKELAKKFKDISFIGIDPIFHSENIKKGSIYELPIEDNSVDMIFVFEVLQYTYVEEALKEIYRVLKKDGIIIIGERNPFSVLGILKPIYEFSNKWMYPWDSPFKERWYKKEEWEMILKKAGFLVKNIKTIEGNGKKFVNRYYFIEGVKI